MYCALINVRWILLFVPAAHLFGLLLNWLHYHLDKHIFFYISYVFRQTNLLINRDEWSIAIDSAASGRTQERCSEDGFHLLLEFWVPSSSNWTATCINILHDASRQTLFNLRLLTLAFYFCSLRVSKKIGWSNEKQIIVNYSSSSSALKSRKAKEMQKEVTKEEADKIGEENKVSFVPAKPEEKKL